MLKHKLVIIQQEDRKLGSNEYHFFTQWGFYLGGLWFPPTGQYLEDEKALEEIAKDYSARLFVRSPNKS